MRKRSVFNRRLRIGTCAMTAIVSNEPFAFAIFRKRLALFKTWVTWLKPKAIPVVSEALEPWQPRAIVLSRFSAEPASSAAVSFGIFVCTASVFGSHQGIRTAVTRYSLLMIRNFDRSRLTFMMSGQLPKRLLMLTAR